MKAYAFLWPSLRPERWRFATAFALTPLVAAAGLVQPLLLKDALDGHVVAGAALARLRQCGRCDGEAAPQVPR